MGIRRKKKQKKGLKIAVKSQKTQVIVCYICGDKGFTNALIDCSKCSDKVAHQYCLGIKPGSIDDTFTWLCEFCSMVPMEVEAMFLRMTDGVSCKNTEGISIDYLKPQKPKSKHEILPVDDEPQPLQIVLPISCNTSLEQRETSNASDNSEQISRTSSASIDGEITTTSPLEQPANIFSKSVLLVSSSGEVFISKHMTFQDPSTSYNLGPSIPSMTLGIIENERRIEYDEKLDVFHSNGTLGVTEIEE